MFTLRSQTVLVRYGTVRYSKRDVCKQRFIAPYRTIPISTSTLEAASLVRYASVRYVKIFACKHSRADVVSLQVVRTRNYIYIVKNCTYDPYRCVPAYLPIHASAEKSNELWPSGQTKKC